MKFQKLPFVKGSFLKTIKKYYRVDRREICFLKFIFEAYDGIVVITTVDRETGIVKLTIPPGCETDVEMVLQDLKNDIMIEAVRSQQLTTD